MSRTASRQPIVAESSNREDNQDGLTIVCGRITDRVLAEEVSRAHVALYMSYEGGFAHPVQHALRESLTAINLSAEVTTAAEHPDAEQVARVAARRRTIAVVTGLEVFAGTGLVRFGGIEIRALLVYCAPPEAESVTVTIPVALVCPPIISAMH